jgi:oligoribonuclease
MLGFDRMFFSKIIDVETQTKLKFSYHWLDLASMYWIKCVSSGKVPESIRLSSIAKTLGLEPENSPHNAMGGIQSLMDCYFTLVKL